MTVSSRKQDFQRADLSGIDLTGADLADANMEGVNLDDADLSAANLMNFRWRIIRSVRNANIEGVKNAPPGFVEWALHAGAFRTPAEPHPTNNR